VLFFSLVSLSLIPIWITHYPPLQDYPDWLLQAQVLRHLNDPTFGFAEYYIAINFPVPNIGSIALIYLLSFVAPIQIAGKLTLSIYVVLFPFAARYFLRAIQIGPSVIEYLSVLLIYNYFFYMGYVGYLLGLSLLLALSGYLWLRKFQLTRATFITVTLGTTALYLTHLMPWIVLGFICTSYAVIWRKQLGSKLLLLAFTFLPSCVLLTLYTKMNAHQLLILPYPLSYWPLKLNVYIEPLVPSVTFRPWPDAISQLPVNLGVLIGVGITVGLALRAARHKAKLNRTQLLNPTVLALASGLAIMIAILPLWFGGLLRPDERLTIPAMLFLLASVRWTRPSWRFDAGLALIIVSGLVFHGITLASSGNEMAKLVNDLAPFVSRDQHPYFMRLPDDCTGSIHGQWPRIEPAIRAGFYWSIERGGNNRQILDTGLVKNKNPIPIENRTIWFESTHDLKQRLPGLQSKVLSDYDTIVLYGCPEPMEQVASLLAPIFIPVRGAVPTSSPYLLVLQRQRSTQP